VTEDIINALTQVEDCTSRRARRASRSKEVRSDSGSAPRCGEHRPRGKRARGQGLRITTQLIDVGDGYHLWSSATIASHDVFAIQDDIAVNIAQKLRVALTDRADEPLVKPPTRNLDAYELYLKARFLVEQRGEGLVKGLEFFRQAIAADPNYALAYAGMAETLCLLAVYGAVDPRQVMPGRERRDAQGAAARRWTRRSAQRDGAGERCTTGAGRARWLEFDRALAINRISFLRTTGKRPFSSRLIANAEEALKETKRAVDLDPIAALPAYALGLVYIGTGRREDAVRVAERMLARDPAHAILYRVVGVARFCLGQFGRSHRGARARRARGCAIRGSSASLNHARGKGDRAEARRLQEELCALARRIFRPTALAVIPIALGDTETALRYFEMAFEHRDLPHRCDELAHRHTAGKSRA
jgi:tetratricopeptide (TPR) repeat protein